MGENKDTSPVIMKPKPVNTIPGEFRGQQMTTDTASVVHRSFVHRSSVPRTANRRLAERQAVSCKPIADVVCRLAGLRAHSLRLEP